jgi:hypothetical protein
MQSTDVLNLGIGLTGVKENRGPTDHICVLHRRFLSSIFVSPNSSHLEPPPRSHSPIPRRRSSTQPPPPPLHTHAPRSARHPHRRPRAPPRSACATTALTRAHAARAPLPPVPPECLRSATTATPLHHRVQNRRSRTPCRPRSRASTLLTPQPPPLSARRVLDILPEPLLALFSHRIRVPALPRALL